MGFSIHTAKMDRNLLKDFAKKNLDISKTALNLLFFLTPLVDRDGKIHFNEDSVRREMVCDRRSFKNAFNELLETTYNDKKLVTKENGYYVSHFHLASDGKKTYLNHLPVFNSAKFLNLTLNQTRLFMYVATLNIWNQDIKVAIENLYKNNLHDTQYGIGYYNRVQDMRNDLFYLIDNGFICVRLPGEETAINKDDVNYKKLFNELCGIENDKKKRTSKKYKEKHKIGLKVNPELYKEKAIENKSGEIELRLLCDRYHMFHEDMKKETFNFIIGKKNVMMEQFGEPGLAIYRNSLNKYFKEKHESIVYYDLLGKAANHFTDFYLLEEIKEVILGALKYDLGSRVELTATGYAFSKTQIPLLVNYFIANSSDEHKVLIDQDIKLIENAEQLLYDEFFAEPPWSDLGDSIESVYVRHIPKVKRIFSVECLKNGLYNPDGLFEKVDSKELVLSLAKKSLLSQQKNLEEEAKKLKQIVLFFRKKKIPVVLEHKPKPVEKKVAGKNFDWLLE